MNRYRKIILLSLKIGIGSSLSLYTAQKLGLNYAVSAGTITLLSLMNSKWETIRLSGSRIASFLITVLAGWILFTNISSMWIAYGILLTFSVFMAEILNWRATISVNGVIAAHLVTYENFNDMAVWNELGIVLLHSQLHYPCCGFGSSNCNTHLPQKNVNKHQQISFGQ